jgi:hypothetical protein
VNLDNTLPTRSPTPGGLLKIRYDSPEAHLTLVNRQSEPLNL